MSSHKLIKILEVVKLPELLDAKRLLKLHGIHFRQKDQAGKTEFLVYEWDAARAANLVGKDYSGIKFFPFNEQTVYKLFGLQ